MDDYESRPVLPQDKRLALIEACIAGNIDMTRSFLSKYRVDVGSITGKMEEIHVGNKTIQSENLNILHLAVYHDQLEIVKLICETIPNLDLAYTGKIPSSSGLANESEISL